MITDTIASLKRAEKSLLDLLDISGRTGPGMLMDLAEWITNESISTQIGGVQDYYDGNDYHYKAWNLATGAKFFIKGWINFTKTAPFDAALERTSIFFREHLEDCIGNIQESIQTLQEAIENEQ